jgi:hypothetical protein
MSDVGDLRLELDRMNARLTALEPKRTDLTIVTHRTAEAWRRRMVMVGIASSLSTAVFMIGIYAMVTLLERDRTPPPAPVVLEPPRPPPPETVSPPPPRDVIAEKPAEPAPEPTVKADTPKKPKSVLEANPYDPNGGSVSDSPGALTVICLPVRCDSITDNGVPLGPGHIFSRPTPPGQHNLILHSPNGGFKKVTVLVKSDETREVRMPMDDPAAPKPASKSGFDPTTIRE